MFGGAKPDRVGGIGVALRFRKREMVRLAMTRYRGRGLFGPRSVWAEVCLGMPFSAVSSRTLRPSARREHLARPSDVTAGLLVEPANR